MMMAMRERKGFQTISLADGIRRYCCSYQEAKDDDDVAEEICKTIDSLCGASSRAGK